MGKEKIGEKSQCPIFPASKFLRVEIRDMGRNFNLKFQLHCLLDFTISLLKYKIPPI